VVGRLGVEGLLRGQPGREQHEQLVVLVEQQVGQAGLLEAGEQARLVRLAAQYLGMFALQAGGGVTRRG
jgi:hypothetical protein